MIQNIENTHAIIQPDFRFLQIHCCFTMKSAMLINKCWGYGQMHHGDSKELRQPQHKSQVFISWKLIPKSSIIKMLPNVVKKEPKQVPQRKRLRKASSPSKSSLDSWDFRIIMKKKVP